MQNIYEVQSSNKRRSTLIVILFFIFISLVIYVLSRAISVYMGYEMGGLGFIGLAFLEIQSPWMAAGGAVRAGLVYFVYRRFSPELTIFLYLMLEGFLLYFSRGYLSLALAGAGVIGLVWIAIRKRFKVKRRNGK